MRLAILGRTHMLIDVAERCVDDGHTIVLVATTDAAPEYKATALDFERLAQRCQAPFFLNPDVNSPEFVATLAASGADIAVSINWPSLVRQEACAALTKGILNAHAGDLPRYRGNACPNWAILNGEPHVGVCVHAMDPLALDAGPVFARGRIPLSTTMYIEDVYHHLEMLLPDLVSEALRNAEAPGFVPAQQDASMGRSLRCFPRRPEDGEIDWNATSERISRLVRASSRPFAGAFSYLEGIDRVTIWRASPVDLDHDVCAVPGQIMGRGPKKGILVASQDGAIEIEEAVVEGRAALPAANRYRLCRKKP